MKINYGFLNEKEGRVVAWHEDTTKKGNYVLTVQDSFGNLIHAVEKKLNNDEISKLKNIPKDDTGL